MNGASLVVQMVKNPPAMRESWVRSLGQEDPLEEGIPPVSSVHWILQARMLEWVAISSSRGSSQPKD